MDIYRVSFIGHREVENLREVEDKLMEILIELFRTKDYVKFQIGRNGEFDTIAASCIKRVQKICDYGNSSMVLVLPYDSADRKYYEDYYDDIIIPEEAGAAHFKSAITKRNKWLVDHSDLLIAYVHREEGGAAKCLKMAEKADIKIIKI